MDAKTRDNLKTIGRLMLKPGVYELLEEVFADSERAERYRKALEEIRRQWSIVSACQIAAEALKEPT